MHVIILLNIEQISESGSDDPTGFLISSSESQNGRDQREWFNVYDLSYLETQRKQVVTIAQDILSGKRELLKERDLRASSALVEKDKEIQQAEEFYRDKAFAACRVLIARFDQLT